MRAYIGHTGAAMCYDLGAGPTEPMTGVVVVMIAALGERPYLVVLGSQATMSDHTW